jgi:FkbM family methyltransferase
MTPFSLTEILHDVPVLKIVHVGASDYPEEAELYDALVDGGHAVLTGFEPNPVELAKLHALARPGRRFLPNIIGNGTPGLFHLTKHPYMSSLLEPNIPLMERFQHLANISEVVMTQNLPTTRLDDIAELGEIDFLQLDVQGGELEVLRGAERLIKSCVIIQTEVEFLPLYKDQPLYSDIDRHLRDRGFWLHTFRGMNGRCFKPMLVREDPLIAINQVLWADATFAIDFRTIESMPTERLKKYALLLHDIYGSADLCLTILIELDRRTGHKHDLEGRYLERLPSDSA